ncbi:MAG: DNA polymerase III subunit beta [Proteobacteria bacterium]|nr:DNA polymerase III subunit beta [Desulfobacterales bacterium]MBL6966909.1 DNA polymerase III subunit beta [Desulfobacteraceae bacterium]MBL7172466.1 DNA polymerase III subunit beta [Desulfobacteraceae bacterium]MBU0736075.1 DNA polymerase III subunit beta [Pseudomonadota bacterium]MBU1903428.1 DNA polymerase III subunit beta [Pseudomonadota bacterium]
MEIKIERNELLKSVSRVQSIIERKSSMPVLSTILFDASGPNVRLSATDLELGFQETIPADVIQEGSITISGRKLFEILKEGSSKTFLIKKKDNNWVYISDEIARFDLACIAADEFPAFIEPEGVATVQIDADTLSDMINKTIYAVTIEEAGFKLSGVFNQKVSYGGKSFLRMVATDGHRLSMIDKPISNVDLLDLGKGVMIPKKGMSELNRLASEGGTIEIGFKHKDCVAKKDNALLVMRLLEAKFPDYQAILPKEGAFSVFLRRSLLLEAMRKMLILSNERYRAVKITLENDVLDLVSTNPDLGEAQEQIQIKYTGERIEAGFNPKYFIDVLQAMQSENISMEFTDNSKPCVLKGDGDIGFTGLIMPMRV